MLNNLKMYEELEELPSRIANSVFRNFSKTFYKKNRRKYWGSRKSDWHYVNGYGPNVIAERVIRCYIGKPFDEAFSRYCKLVPKYQQKFFHNEFSPNYRWNDFLIDDNGDIQFAREQNKYKGPYNFYSLDYRQEERHIKTGALKPRYNLWGEKDDLYVKVIVSGFTEVFETKKEKRFQRLNAEKNRAYRKSKRKLKKITISDTEFRRVLREKELKEREENLIKIISHGFDPSTSFRKRKKENNDDTV